MFALQDIVKTVKYRKWCFDQIEPTFKENEELAAEVDQLCKKLKTTEKEKENEKAELEASQCNTITQLSQKERERTSKLLSRVSRALKSVVNTYSYTD
jgi:Skp family chaperone for outer membrane proteins